jgi:hypothetical protein
VKQTTLNKRKQKRFVERCNIEFVSDGIRYDGISSDFSLDGLFIRTRSLKVPGTILDIILHLPDGSTSELQGRVRRFWIETPIQAARNGMGIEIIEKDANYLNFIRSLLATSKETLLCRTPQEDRQLMHQQHKEPQPSHEQVREQEKCSAHVNSESDEKERRSLDEILLDHISKKVKK